MRTAHGMSLLLLLAACTRQPVEDVNPDRSEGSVAANMSMRREAESHFAEANMRKMLDAPESPVNRPFNGRTAMLKEDMHYTIGHSGLTITVPKGFVTDFASIPREFWILIPPMGSYTRAAVVHDWLYWTQVCSREQSDNLLLKAMVESEVSDGVRWMIFRAVRYFGSDAWDGNAMEKRAGYVHLVAPPFDVFPPNTEWEKYREQLRAQHTPDVPKPTDLRFCQLGNGRDNFY